MTRLLLSIFFLAGHFVFGQSIDSINKIVIEYGKSHNSWGRAGIYGKAEVIELSKTSRGEFTISRHFTATTSTGDDGKTFHSDTLELSTKSSDVIPGEKIQFWLTQLNTNKDNFTVSFIRPKLTPPTKKEIFQVAKEYDKLWMLKGSDGDREDTKKVIRGIQNYDELDSFLIFKRPTIAYDMIVTDNYNGLRIITINNSDTTEYRCQFFEPLGQPITRYNNRNYLTGTRVFNLETNTSARSFLPANSTVSKALDLNNIKEEYIKWYLDRKT